MKKFIFRLLYIIPIPLVIMAVNYFVDPANIFDKKYEQGIANYLVQGCNVTNVINYNERLLQKDYIEKMTKHPDQIILGSSRVMQISKDVIQNENMINNGVSGATFEDMLAIYYLYERKGNNIKKVMLGIDPWMLNDNHGQVRWQDINDVYYAFVSKLYKPVPKSRRSFIYKYMKYKELLSLSYFKTSITYTVQGLDKKYKPTKNGVNETFTRLVDGSIYYDIAYRSKSVEQIDKMVKMSISKNNPTHSLKNFTKLSEKYCTMLSKFVEYMQDKGIEVEFFLPPFHPLLYTYFETEKEYNMVGETEKYIVNFAAEHQVKVYGSFDPAKCNLDNTFFYDGLHPSYDANKVLLQ